jgi:hypothetical protein
LKRNDNNGDGVGSEGAEDSGDESESGGGVNGESWVNSGERSREEKETCCGVEWLKPPGMKGELGSEMGELR